MEHIAFIGGGNMATAILGGLIAQDMAPTQITVIDPGADQRAHLQATYGVRTTDNVAAGCAEADTVVLAVKPQVISEVAERVAGALKGKLLISIAAGGARCPARGALWPRGHRPNHAQHPSLAGAWRDRPLREQPCGRRAACPGL